MYRHALRTGLLIASLAWAPGMVAAHDGHAHGSPQPAPSTGYAYPLARPGTYALPAIKRAAGGSVLDEQGHRRDLADILRGRITVLAFIYTRCGDVCPTASMQLAALRDIAGRDLRGADRLQLISMSFDPDHDTPTVMAEHARQWRDGGRGPRWLFVTAPDRERLAPILSAYGQSVMPQPGPPGGPNLLAHILRVFLVDRSGMVRNIYSIDFLDPQLVLNDVRTLLLQEGRSPAPEARLR